jgi:hypothetical protein
LNKAKAFLILLFYLSKKKITQTHLPLHIM